MKRNITILAILIFSTTLGFSQSDEEITNDEYPLTSADVAVATKEKRGAYTSYKASDGTYFKVGDVLTLGQPGNGDVFSYIQEGDGLLIPMTSVNGRFAGGKTEVKRIMLMGNKRSGFYVYLRTKGYTGLANYSIYIENALTTGEIVTTGFTSNEALEELKRAKDKLDLEIITQVEYDSIKSVLVQYIK